MPMIDVTLPAGLLTASAKDELASRLTAALLSAEGAPDTHYVRAIAWCFFDERPLGAIQVGGRPARVPVYRVVLTIPEGSPALSGPFRLVNRERLVHEVTEHVLAVEGTPYSDAEAARVWVALREIKEGYWGAVGGIGRLEDLAGVTGAPPDGTLTDNGDRVRAALDASALTLMEPALPVRPGPPSEWPRDRAG
jgi:phenylpyruvate tautomerase PptA (4-oxalocrotonate tautomerase family)